MKNLTYIASKVHITDKGKKEVGYHNFTDFYNDEFERIHDIARHEKRPVRILEIGLFHGDSALMYDEFFDGECEIYSLEIDENLVNEFNRTKARPNIHIMVGNQSDEEVLYKIRNMFINRKFDIILDDGSHEHEDQMRTLVILSDILAYDGIYILEDLHTSLPDEPRYCQGTDKTNTPLFTLLFNKDSIYLTDEQNRKLRDTIKSIQIYERRNDYIEFGCSITSIIRFR